MGNVCLFVLVVHEIFLQIQRVIIQGECVVVLCIGVCVLLQYRIDVQSGLFGVVSVAQGWVTQGVPSLLYLKEMLCMCCWTAVRV